MTRTWWRPVTLASVLLGLLALSAVSIYLRRGGSEIEPNTTNFDAGGAAAFATLLRSHGYEVESSTSMPSERRSDELLIAFVEESSSSAPDFSNDDEAEAATQAQSSPLYQGLLRHMRAGGPVMTLTLGLGTERLRQLVEVRADGPLTTSKSWSLQLPAQSSNDASWPDSTAVDADAIAWFTGRRRLVELFQLQGCPGIGVHVTDGSFVLNEALDRGQNAGFALETVKLAALGIKKIRFIDGSFEGLRDPTVLDVLGPWAHGAWSQLLVLVAVIVGTTAVRFGLPKSIRARERSSRELLDGISDTMARGRLTHWALHELARAVDQKVRLRLGISSQASAIERNRVLPPKLAQMLNAAEGASQMSEAEAIYIARALETEADAWLSARAGV